MSVNLTADEILRFHEDGFLSVSGITSTQEVAWMLELYDRLFDRRAGWDAGDFFDFAGIDSPGSTAALPQLLNPSRYEPALKKTLFHANAHAVARQLLGPAAELVFEHAMMKPARNGGETPWHQDEAFYPKYTDYQSITIWMPLQPVDARNGCMELIPGSHRNRLLNHRSINDDPRIHGLEAEGADASLAVRCPLEAGGATVHHFRTLHHAGPNLSEGPRRAYALGFGVRSAKYLLRQEFPWNEQRATAREQRASAARSPIQHYVRQMKNAAKGILR
jgi:ectoine hydroxylase-related dioxygenase (phytanoyl-CoA dioxygenase family)